MTDKSPIELVELLRNRVGKDNPRELLAGILNLCSKTVDPPARVTYYVDNVNGSDANPGTAVAPFKTLNRAMGLIPTIVTDIYYVYLTDTGTPYDGTECLIRQFLMASGSIVIAGRSRNVLYTGTVTTGGTLQFTDTGQSWTVDELTGKSFTFTSTTGGNSEILNWQSTVVENTANTILIGDNTWTVSVGDEFEVFEPAVEIDVSPVIGGSLATRGFNLLNNNNAAQFNQDRNNSFTFSNVRLNQTHGESLTLYEGDMDFSGVEINGDGSNAYFLGHVTCGALAKNVLRGQEDKLESAKGWGLYVYDLVFTAFGGGAELNGFVSDATSYNGVFYGSNLYFSSGRLHSTLWIRHSSTVQAGTGGASTNGNAIFKPINGVTNPALTDAIRVSPTSSLTYDLTCDIDWTSITNSLGILNRGRVSAQGSAHIDVDLEAIRTYPGATTYIDGATTNHTVNGAAAGAYTVGLVTPTVSASGAGGSLASSPSVVTNEGATLVRDDTIII